MDDAERQKHVDEAWARYQEKIALLRERRSAVLAREDARLSGDRLNAIRARLGLSK